MLHLTALHPFPPAATGALERARRLIAVEGNVTGQLETLIRARTGIAVDGSIRRYDGRAFTPETIVNRFEQEV
jgi:pyruvate/2-oxoacid:ferredoxin oxidoreductase alpha subunit